MAATPTTAHEELTRSGFQTTSPSAYLPIVGGRRERKVRV